MPHEPVQFVDEFGTRLDAHASLSFEDMDTAIWTIESQGAGRNKDYFKAYDLTLARLATISATLSDCLVVSADTRDLPIEERRVLLADEPYPIQLHPDLDTTQLARRLRSTAAQIGRRGGATGPGNRARRVELKLSVEGLGGQPQGWLREVLEAPKISVSGSSAAAGEPEPTLLERVPEGHGRARFQHLDPLSDTGVQQELKSSNAFDALNDRDARTKVLTSIARRRGQPKFRLDLLAAYAGRCAVTGCSAVDVLEGAHIKSYRGDHTNHVTNGLLLRADIHTLFDLGLLRINPATLLLQVADRVRSDYGRYDGKPLRLPAREDQWPDTEAVRQHYERCSPNFCR